MRKISSIKKKQQILFVITGLNQGGAEEMLFKLLSCIDRSRFECNVISMLDVGVYGEKITSLDIPIFCLKMKSGCISLLALIAYLKLVIEIKPDITQGWMYHANLFSVFSKILLPKSSISKIKI